MGDMPFLIDGIAGKTAANLIVDATLSDFAQAEVYMIQQAMVFIDAAIAQKE